MPRAWTAAEVLAIFDQISNWGRWGEDDELGTLNFITSAKVLEAASLVRRGRVISVGRDLSTVRSGMNPQPMEHHMGKILPGKNTVTDGINIHNHGPQTHVDPPAHVFHNGKVYGGRSIEDVIRPDGLAFGSIHSKREGVVTRGVLLDVPAARGVEWLDPTELVTRDDLDTAERRAGVTVGPGDAAFVRIGVGALNAARGIDDITVRAGLGPDCAVWFHERSVAVACNDGPEKLPLFLPEVGPVWHIAAQVYMGLTSLESPNTERLLEVCREEGRSEFMLMFAPMRIPRGTGSLVNPLCVF